MWSRTDSERALDLQEERSAPLLDATTRGRPRIDLFDNAKAVLIVCVVLYQTAVVYTSADRPESPIPVWSGLLALLKTVVMPTFCLISGHLSRAEIDRRRAIGMAQLLATYCIFQTLYHFNNLLSFRLNGFDHDAFPVQVIGDTVK